MTREQLIEMCEKIANDSKANDAIASLAASAKAEYARERVKNARNFSAIKAAKKILDANKRIDEETRNNLLGLMEVDE